jgi:zinc transport system permease protein
VSAFWEALWDPDIAFLRMAVLMGLLASFAFGMTGTFVVVKRISYVAGAIAHAVLGGIGFALYFQRVHGISWLHPLLGAWLAALLAAVIIAVIRARGLERDDTVIGAVWAIGMATGLVFLSRVPGYVDPLSYLFGNMLILSAQDLVMVAILDGVLVISLLAGYRHLQALSFDEELARLRGLNVPLWTTVLYCMIASAIVLLVSLVGVVLVVALLTLPAAMASRGARSLGWVMALATGYTLVFILLGLFLSFASDWPTGPTIILVAAAAFVSQPLVRLLLQRGNAP